MLDETNFKEIGLDYIINLKSSIDLLNNNFIFNIKLKTNSSINVIFNSKFIPISGDIIYFKGNYTKNEWFNNITLMKNKDNNKLVIEAIKYILCKEIGDVLQAYYGKIYLDTLEDNNRDKCCLFTCDLILKLKCILLKVPVVSRNYDENKCEITLYDTSNKEMALEIKKMHLENVLLHNKINIELLKNVIEKKYCILNNSKIPFNAKIVLYLNNIIKYIENKSYDINAIDINKNIVEDYRKKILKYKSELLFFKNQNDEYKLYLNIFYLFPGIKDDKNDLIFKHKRPFNELLATLSKQYGGVYIEKTKNMEELYKTDINTYENYSKKVDKLMETNSSDALKLCLYWNLKKISLSSFDISTIDDVESLYNVLFHFYDYMGITCVNDDFIQIVIRLYKTNELHKITFEEFEKLFNTWAENINVSKQIINNEGINNNMLIKTKKRKIVNNRNYNFTRKNKLKQMMNKRHIIASY